MNPKLLTREWAQYEPMFPRDRALKLLKGVEGFISQPILHVVPSVALGTDGPYMASLFFVSEHYLVERHLSDPDLPDLELPPEDVLDQRDLFDVILLRSVWNYRVWVGATSVGRADGSRVTYDLARISLKHRPADEFTSTITYVGSARATWLRGLVEAIPVAVLQR